MANPPIKPWPKYDRAASRREAFEEYHRRAHRITDYINESIAADPSSIQRYNYDTLSRRLGFTAKEIEKAIGQGDSGGLDVVVTAEDRETLSLYLAGRKSL